MQRVSTDLEHIVSTLLETMCFLTGNKMFLTEKRSVSHSETNCFTTGNKVFFQDAQI